MDQVLELEGVGRIVYDVIEKKTPCVCIVDIRPAPDVTELVIPATIEGYPVTSLLSFAGGSRGNDTVVSITVPEGVETISHAFNDYTALVRVNLPKSIKKIGLYAFQDCTNLRDIPLPEGLEELSYGAFSGCKALGDITLPDTLEKLELESYERQVNVFEHAHVEKLTLSARQLAKFHRVLKRVWADEVVITGTTDDPDTGREFLKSNYLKKLTLPRGLTELGEEAFAFCHNLTEIAVPDGITRLGVCAFECCSELRSVPLSPAVDTVPYRCFDGCESLANIDLSHVKNIGGHAFSGCASLTRVELSEDLVFSDGEAFKDCVKLAEVTLPSRLTKLPDLTFEGCTALTAVTLPAALQEIGYGAFRGCASLAALHIPASVTKIGARAFAGCEALASLSVDADNPVFYAEGNVLYLKETGEIVPAFD